MLRGQRENIVSTHFIADPTGSPNSDIFVIVLENGQKITTTSDADMLRDLRKRFGLFLKHGPALKKALRKYDKLVRDKVVHKIRAKGERVRFHTAGAEEYGAKLREKLVEEAREFAESGSPEELADLLEVVDAILVFEKIERADLKRLKKKKLASHGGFAKRIILDEA